MAETQQPPTKNIFVPHNSRIGNSIIVVFMMHRGFKEMGYKSLTKILRAPILQGRIPSLKRTRLVFFSPKPEVFRGLNQCKSYVHLWKNKGLSLSVRGY